MSSHSPILLITEDQEFESSLISTLNEIDLEIQRHNTLNTIDSSSWKSNPSIVLLDLDQISQSGPSLLNCQQILNKQAPDIPYLLFATQTSSIPDKESNFISGAFAFFSKSESKSKLLAAIHSAIDFTTYFGNTSEKENLLQILFTDSKNPILVIDDQGKYIQANHAACEFLECTLSELQNKTVFDFTPPGVDNENILESHKQLWDDGGTIKTEFFIKGRIKTLMLSITSGTLNDKKVFFGLGTDINKIIKSESELSYREDLIKTILDNLPIGIAVNTIEPTNKILYINKNFPKIFKISEDKTKHTETFWKAAYEDPEFREYIKKKILGDIESGDPERLFWPDIPIKRKGEKTFYITERATMLPKKNLMIWSIWDTSDKKQAEQLLIESEQRFKWLYINAPIPYHILTTSGFIDDVNQRWCDVMGYTKEEVLGKEIFNFIVEDEREAARQSFRNKKISKKAFIEGSERKYRTKSGEIRIFRTFDFLVTNKEKNIQFIQTTIEDITKQKQAEEEQKRNLDRMRRLVEILQFPFKNNQEFLDFALSQAIELTQSKFGFIQSYDKKKKEVAWVSLSKNIPLPGDFQKVFPLDKIGLLGEAIRKRRPIIINSYRNNLNKRILPDFHIKFNNFVSIPIFIENEIVAQILVADRKTDYEESDVLQLSLLMETVWRVVERRSAVTALHNTEVIQNNLINATQDIVLLKDENLNIIMTNQTALDFFKKPISEIIGKSYFDLIPKGFAEEWEKTDKQALETEEMVQTIIEYNDHFYDSRKFRVPIGNKRFGVGVFIRDITAQIESEASLKLQTTALRATANAIVITNAKGIIEWANPAFTKLTGYTVEDSIGLNPRDLVYSGFQDQSFYNGMWDTITNGDVWEGQLINKRKDGSYYTEQMTITPLMNDQHEVIHFIAIMQDITEREQRERELTVVANVSAALRSANTREEMYPIILDQLIDQLNVEGSTIVIRDPDTNEMVIELGRGLWASSTGTRVPPGKGLSRKILDGGKAYLYRETKDPNAYYPDLFVSCDNTAAVPLIVQDHKLGVLFIGANRFLDKKDVRLLTAVADIAANAIHRTTLHERTQVKVNQLNSLRIIDQAINTSLDLRVTLDVILKQSHHLLKCDALLVLLSKPQTMWLEHAASYGFKSNDVEKINLHIGRGIAGKSILENRLISSTDEDVLQDYDADRVFHEKENFVNYYASPLVIKGEVKGVLLVGFRKQFKPNQDWRDIFNTLATQTAIAIDNNQLFTNLQRSTVNLSVAYNETIEGWAKALELRDKETQGHSKRVTEMTIRLANEAGVSDDEIGNIMRGALLHDIGKMGIPDAILNKPGKLTEEEWVIVKNHPQDAYNMLSSIKYLKPALDIPYCHHERWDGTGYPRGLQGKEIPLAARIFAVVDVWDALTSDRPYRQAWPVFKAKEYMLSQAGKHFDPEIVNIFFSKVVIL